MRWLSNSHRRYHFSQSGWRRHEPLASIFTTSAIVRRRRRGDPGHECDRTLARWRRRGASVGVGSNRWRWRRHGHEHDRRHKPPHRDLAGSPNHARVFVFVLENDRIASLEIKSVEPREPGTGRLRALVTGGTQGRRAKQWWRGCAMRVRACSRPHGRSSPAFPTRCTSWPRIWRQLRAAVDRGRRHRTSRRRGHRRPCRRRVRRPASGFAVLDNEQWRRAIDLNLLAAVRLDRALLPAMIARGSGVITYVGSIQARLPQPEATIAYAAAKAALRTIARPCRGSQIPRAFAVSARVARLGRDRRRCAARQRARARKGVHYDAARRGRMELDRGIQLRQQPSHAKSRTDRFPGLARAASITGISNM